MNPVLDVRNEEELRTYFARLEAEYPQLADALKVLNISYRQYLLALQSMSRPTSTSTSSTLLSF